MQLRPVNHERPPSVEADYFINAQMQTLCNHRMNKRIVIHMLSILYMKNDAKIHNINVDLSNTTSYCSVTTKSEAAATQWFINLSTSSPTHTETHRRDDTTYITKYTFYI